MPPSSYGHFFHIEDQPEKVLFGTTSVSQIQKILLFHECSHVHGTLFVFMKKSCFFGLYKRFWVILGILGELAE